MQLVSDLHLHSRYSLATSPRLELASLADAGKEVGIHLLAAPDFTHPVWRDEMRRQLEPAHDGSGLFGFAGVHFLLVSEVSCVWRQDGRSRRVHLLLTAPDFAAVDRMCSKFSELQNLESDGRPILKVSARELLSVVREADPRCEVVPAHVFTPWYGVFGAKSGFDSLAECFGDSSDEIFAVETGLSSDPAMLWTIPDTRNRAIVSFSDAHSVTSVGREATVLLVADLSYNGVIDALKRGNVVETREFHPQHGKYYLDGHRKCGIRLLPDGSREFDGVCPKCGKGLTLGVLNRCVSLSDSPRVEPNRASNGLLTDPSGLLPPYRHLIQLRELIAHALHVGPKTKKVTNIRSTLIDAFGREFNVLMDASASEIAAVAESEPVAIAVDNARNGRVSVDPGYDGVYGVAKPMLNAPTGIDRVGQGGQYAN